MFTVVTVCVQDLGATDEELVDVETPTDSELKPSETALPQDTNVSTCETTLRQTSYVPTQTNTASTLVPKKKRKQSLVGLLEPQDKIEFSEVSTIV